MKSLVKHWWNREGGTLSVDWVVVSAAVVGLGLASVAAIRSGSTTGGFSAQGGIATASILPMASQAPGSDGLQWSLLTMSQPMFEAHLAFFGEVDQATRNLYYVDYASMVSAMITARDVHSAGLYLDAMAAVVRATNAAGEVLTVSGPTITDLGDRFNALLG